MLSPEWLLKVAMAGVEFSTKAKGRCRNRVVALAQTQKQMHLMSEMMGESIVPASGNRHNYSLVHLCVWQVIQLFTLVAVASVAFVLSWQHELPTTEY